MIIKSTEFDERKFLFEVNIDDSLYLVSYEIYEELNLKPELEISMKDFQLIEAEDKYQKAKRIAENYINYKFRTKFEVILKLRRDIDDEVVINRVISHYEKLSLLDDDRYAKEYIEYSLNSKLYSKNFIKYKLNSKGISNNISQKYLEQYDDDIEIKNIIALIDKKYKFKDINEDTVKQKLYRYLSSKGFSFDIIKRAINEYEE